MYICEVMARPSKYSQQIADKICHLVSTQTKGIQRICAENSDIPSYVTIYSWLNNNEAFLKQYTRAKEDQADLLVTEMLEIADQSENDIEQIELGDGVVIEKEKKEVVNRSRLRVETRKWIASKLKPKKYGDKIDVTTGNEPLNNTPVLNITIDGEKINLK